MDTLLTFKDNIMSFFNTRPSNPLDPVTDFERDLDKCLRLSIVSKQQASLQSQKEEARTSEQAQKLEKVKLKI